MNRANTGEVRSGGGRERREHPRVEAPWPVMLSLESGACVARLRDISRAGVCFFLDRPIGLMTLLSLSLDLPLEAGPRSIQGHGAVVRCERISPSLEHYEIAVFLHDMSDADRAAIDVHVRERPAV